MIPPFGGAKVSRSFKRKFSCAPSIFCARVHLYSGISSGAEIFAIIFRKMTILNIFVQVVSENMKKFIDWESQIFYDVV